MAKVSLDLNDKQIQAQQNELLEKFDKESKTRKFENKNLAKTIFWIAVIISLYHFITSFVGYPATHKHRSLHVAMMLFMTFF